MQTRAPKPTTTAGQDVAIGLGGEAGALIGALLSQSILAYGLGPAGRGSLSVCLMFALLTGMLGTPGAVYGSQYYLMTRKISVSQAVCLALFICLAGSGLIIVLLVLPLIRSDFAFFRQAPIHSFQLSFILIFLHAFSLALQHLLIGLRLFLQAGIFVLIRSWMLPSALALLHWGPGMDVDAAIIASGLALAATIAYSLRYLWKNCGLRPAMPALSEFPRVIGYGLRFHGAFVGMAVEGRLGHLLLAFLSNRTEVGLLAVASGLMHQASTLASTVSAAALPRIAASTGSRQEAIAQALRLVCWITGGGLAVAVAACPWFVPLLFSEAFEPAVPLFGILAPGIVAYAAYIVLRAYFQGVNRPEICSWAVWLGFAATVATLFAFGNRIDAAAAAWATSVGLLVRCLIVVIVYRAKTGMPWSRMWLPMRGDLAFLLATGRTVFNRKASRSDASRSP